MHGWMDGQADRQTDSPKASKDPAVSVAGAYVPLLPHSLHTSLLLPRMHHALSYLKGFVYTVPSAWNIPLLFN